MPEGDSIFRAARTLQRALAGKQVTAFESVLPALNRIHEDAPVTGRTIERVAAIGKHLLIHFSGNLVLRTHMRMSGSWHIYRSGERWHGPRRDLRLRPSTAEFEAVGFTIPVAEFITAAGLSKHADLRRLGPDVLSDSFDEAKVVENLRSRPAVEIADALLDQRVLAGL